jgi:protein TonB
MALLLVHFSPVQSRPLQVIEVDFSLNRGPWKQVAPKVAAKAIPKRPGGSKEGTKPWGSVVPDPPVGTSPEHLSPGEEEVLSPLPALVTAPAAPAEAAILPPANVQSETIPRAVAVPKAAVSLGTATGDAGDHRSMGALPAPPGSGDAGQEGSPSRAEQGTPESLMAGNGNYNYIRHAVMENIRYPDRARRLGYEGKVLLSFVVLEDGTTTEIRVINGSCYRILDDSAKEAVAQTRLARTMPYRVVVRLPITYKLQKGKDGRK